MLGTHNILYPAKAVIELVSLKIIHNVKLTKRGIKIAEVPFDISDKRKTARRGLVLRLPFSVMVNNSSGYFSCNRTRGVITFDISVLRYYSVYI